MIPPVTNVFSTVIALYLAHSASSQAVSNQSAHCPFLTPGLQDYGKCLPSEGDKVSLTSNKENAGGFPWEFKPFCAKDSTKATKYCVYTSVSFNNGVGASFITHPDALPAVLTWVNDITLTQQGKKYLSGRDRPTDIEAPYEVKRLPGKGLSVVARRSIPRGTIFMVGFPAVVVDQELEMGPDPDVSESDRLRLHELAFEQLSDKERALSLAASTGGNIYEDVMRTNAFGIKISGRGHSGLYPEIAVGFLIQKEGP
jgi:hypothetical protein